MSGPLLIAGDLKKFSAQGAGGASVYSQAAQIRTAIRRQIGPQAAEMLAIPQGNEAGDRLDWYAPFDGMVVPWSSATEEERAPAREALQQARAQFSETGARLLAAGGSDSAIMFARMLPLALRIPSESHIFLVDGRPVVTFWGFSNLDGDMEYDVIGALAAPVPPPPAAAQMAAPVPPVAPVMAPPPRRNWLWWLLALLLLLLLLGLLLFGLKGCNSPDLPAADTALPQVDGPNGVITSPDEEARKEAPDLVIPGGVAPVIGEPGAGGTAGAVDGAVIPTDGAIPPITEPENAGAAEAPRQEALPATETQPTTPDQPVTPPQPTDAAMDENMPPPGVMPADQPQAGTQPGLQAKPLQLPQPGTPEAQAGKVNFLDGSWKSRSALMDSRTGKPLDVQYQFKDGQGTTTIRRSDGTACTAPARAAMTAGKLVITQDSPATCPDGSSFTPTRVECSPGSNGAAASCRGVNSGGPGYAVDITR